MKRAIVFLALLVLASISAPSWCSDIDPLVEWRKVQNSVSCLIPWAGEVSWSKSSTRPEMPIWICHKGSHLLFGVDESSRRLFGCWPVATGRRTGQKRKAGDMRTPEGIFSVQRIQDASYWRPYKDRETGESVGYGPWFIRLKTPPWSGIGIHGTDEEHLSEIGTDASHGCIRMRNADLIEVKRIVRPGQKVLVIP